MLSKIAQLRELTLSKLVGYAVDSEANWSAESYRIILFGLKKLEKLEMVIPKQKTLALGTEDPSVDRMDMRDRGVGLLAANLPDLLKLNLGWNGISADGIGLLVGRLTNLKCLDVRTLVVSAEGNKIGNRGVVLIAENLLQLRGLFIGTKQDKSE